MQVVECERDGACGAEPFDERGDGVHDPETKPWKLGGRSRPAGAGGVAGEEPADLGPIRFVRLPREPEGVGDRAERPLALELLGRACEQPHAERFGRPRGVVEEARLADSGLALDQHDPPPATGNVFERGLEDRLLAATSEW